MNKKVCHSVAVIILLTIVTAYGQTIVEPEIQLFFTPNQPSYLKYIPSQNFAAYPDRIKWHRWQLALTGMEELAPDLQAPIEEGVQFVNDQPCFHTVHYRRAGAQCNNGAVFYLRMESFKLATLALGVKVKNQVVLLKDFEQKEFQVFPGRVVYDFEHRELQLVVHVELVCPVSVPAYGQIIKLTVQNQSSQNQNIEVIAAMSPGHQIPEKSELSIPKNINHLKIDVPQESNPMLLHDTDYDLLLKFDGEMVDYGNYLIAQKINLKPSSKKETCLSVILDSPGYDEAFVKKRIGGYFNNNQNLSAKTRERLINEAIETFAGIVSDGDQAFLKITKDPSKVFSDSRELSQRGVFRNQKVHFDMPDKKLASYANLLANDHFPGIFQPPGLVHSSKDGMLYWQYIFCYRHDHAASNINLENAAIDYLRLLSCNQQEDGWIQGKKIDFKTDGHFTKFDASYIDALHHYYKWTGDLEAVRELWPTVTKAVDYIESSLNPDGDDLYRDLIHQWKSDFDNRGPSSSYQTSIVWKAYCDLAELAELIHDSTKAKHYQTKADNIHHAVQKELWSDEFGMLGPKGPLGIIRLHPQSLEVEMPVWTGLVDDYQGVMLTDWYLKNLGFSDAEGGLWMFDNDWWPLTWSQHYPSPGDYIMVGWALMKMGRYNEGAKILETVAGASFRREKPCLNYGFTENGAMAKTANDHTDVATGLGSLFRVIVEGLFGVRPNIDQGKIAIRPQLPDDWDHASFQRDGLAMRWKKSGEKQSLQVQTNEDIKAVVEIPVQSAVKNVTINGKNADYSIKPAMRHAIVLVETQSGGGIVEVETAPKNWQIVAPAKATAGDIITIQLNGLDGYKVIDKYHFFEIVDKSSHQLTAKIKRPGSGLAGLFFECTKGNINWIEPVTIETLPPTAKEFQELTIKKTIPEQSEFVQLDLSQSCTDNINTCFDHNFHWDAEERVDASYTGWFSDITKQPGIHYWTQPLFVLNEAVPQQIKVGDIPFKLGKMDRSLDKSQKNLIMLANTPPREIPTSAVIPINSRKLHKIYLLSLNMHLPQKSYVPAVEIIVHYQDKSTTELQMISPLNFDCYYQNNAINTVAYPISTKPGYSMKERLWKEHENGFHLTMTDVACDPLKKVTSIEIKSIATETFFGLAGVTLVEARE